MELLPSMLPLLILARGDKVGVLSPANSSGKNIESRKVVLVAVSLAADLRSILTFLLLILSGEDKIGSANFLAER